MARGLSRKSESGRSKIAPPIIKVVIPTGLIYIFSLHLPKVKCLQYLLSKSVRQHRARIRHQHLREACQRANENQSHILYSQWAWAQSDLSESDAL
jgi:hypothetical protein